MSDIQYFSSVESPIGSLYLYQEGSSLIRLSFGPATAVPAVSFAPDEFIEAQSPLLDKTRQQLLAYFDGAATHFDIPIHLKGTPFQKAAWDILVRIPFGKTVTYSEQSIKLGGPHYNRAVGQANRQNPIPIIIPCHRVIGKNKKLTGYAGGLSIKKWLLDHEQEV